MPLIRREQAPTPGGDAGKAADIAADTARLRASEPEQRRAAARALAGRADALTSLAEALAVENVAAVRDALLDAISRIGNQAAARHLVPALRSDDAGLRNAALAALQSMPAELPLLLSDLLADADGDVRILATELARALPPEQATLILCAMLERESHPNAAGAALDVLAEIGTPSALATLRRVAERFAADPFVGFAARTTISRIGG